MLFRLIAVFLALWCVTAPARAQEGVPDTGGVMVEDPDSVQEEVEEAPATKEADKKGGKAADDKKGDAAEGADATVPQPEPDAVYTNGIVLQGLNKVTARIQKLDGPMGTVMRFGNLEIIPRRCWKSSPEALPENAALLEVWELKPGEGPQRIFLGWMFSSSPGLSSLQHPVYDLTVIDCEERKPDAD